jgi:uncharacterized protein (DUF1800 family)
VWGKFRDLLGTSAKSPAMLFYLDMRDRRGDYSATFGGYSP